MPQPERQPDRDDLLFPAIDLLPNVTRSSSPESLLMSRVCYLTPFESDLLHV